MNTEHIKLITDCVGAIALLVFFYFTFKLLKGDED